MLDAGFCFQIIDQGNNTQLLRVSGQTNGSIFSDTNNVELYFTSDFSVTETGFLIEYSQVEGKLPKALQLEVLSHGCLRGKVSRVV